MRIKYYTILLTIVVCGNILSLGAQTMSATEIITKADEKFNGEKSGMSTMVMTIVRPAWQRIIEFKNWSMGRRIHLRS